MKPTCRSLLSEMMAALTQLYVITLPLLLFKCQQKVALPRNVIKGSKIKEALRCVLSHKKSNSKQTGKKSFST
jgi:hypothetical protein